MTQVAQGTKPAKTAKVRQPKVRKLDLGDTGRKLLDKLANARAERLAAEKVEKPLASTLKQLFADEATKLKQGDTLIIEAKGVVRGRVTLNPGAKSVDLDLLKEGWPEAFQACVSDTEHLRFSPV